MILFTPGPCMTTETVRQAGAIPDLNHREPAFSEIASFVRKALLGIQPGMADWTPYLLGGSGTAAVEAMVSSCVRSGPVLVVENGYYSARIREILEIHRIPFEAVVSPWDQPLDEETVIQRLEQQPFEAVILTHHETTLGFLNPVARIAEYARTRGTRVLVDAMSSFGADLLDVEHVDAVAASANKCLHGQPGVSFVLARPSMAEAMSEVPRRSYYLHLPMYGGENPPLTPPVPTLASFAQALREIPAGQPERYAEYAQKLDVVRDGLLSRGFSVIPEPGLGSITLVSATIPNGWTWDRWFAANLERGFVLYGTKPPFRERLFQVSVMGATTPNQYRDWLDVVDSLL